MTQIFDAEQRNVTPVTLIEVAPSNILEKKTIEKDGYTALQIGSQELTKESKQKKSQKGKAFRVIREFRTDQTDDVSVGDVVSISALAPGDTVRISGVSKGKGFQGGVKRWGFHGRNASHGVKHEQRTIGSIGSQFPQRVVKGRKMPGQTGRDRVTLHTVKVVAVDEKSNVLAVKGAVPGGKGTLLEIQGA